MLWQFVRSLLEPGPDRVIEGALALRRRGDLAGAERVLRDAAVRFPRNAAAAVNLGLVFIEQHRGADGAAELERALALEPENTAAHYNLATLHRVSGRHDAAVEHYTLAAALPHPIPLARQELMFVLLEACDWSRATPHAQALQTLCAEQAPGWQRGVAPLTAVYLGLDPAACLRVARWHAEEAARDVQPVHPARRPRARARLRVGYLSPDLRNHPVGQLMSASLPLHDRDACEIFVYSYGVDDGSAYRERIAANVEHFIDVAAWSDEVTARKIAEHGIDVLVDLAGHTSEGRLGILARRPAPVQAHYLGYPGSTGAPYIDCFVSDAIATPAAMADAFSERIARVPACFMAGGETMEAPPAERAAEGLPDDACVYACFTGGSRITPEVFSLWMEILRGAPRGVLWLSQGRASTQTHLRKAAADAGIDPRRLVFARRTPRKADHLARLALADVALDTVGWHNGHSTTHDMLWAGLPVLTAAGAAFASRVGASLVTGAGLPALVASDHAEYVRIAVLLGRETDRREALKRSLSASRDSAPLFDTRRLVRDLEALYRQVSEERCRAGSA